MEQGYQAARALKSQTETKDIPLVFLSAKAQQADIDKGRTFGVTDYLTKPFDPTELLDVIDRLTI